MDKDYKEKIVQEKIKDNIMKNGITWEECEDRFKNVVGIYDSHTLEAWEYFKNIYKDIPQEHRLKIQLLSIYTYSNYNSYEFYEYLKKSLEEESENQRKNRIQNNKKILKDYLFKYEDSEGGIHYFIKLYRGVNENSLGEELALSYTVSRKVAERFANRFPQFNDSQVIEKDFHIKEVLFYTNDREEEEVIVIPDELECFEEYFEDYI